MHILPPGAAATPPPPPPVATRLIKFTIQYISVTQFNVRGYKIQYKTLYGPVYDSKGKGQRKAIPLQAWTGP
jgi:hypothetical protein